MLDTDTNDLVDALEVLAALAMVSGMRDRDKLEFMMNAYDFDGSQELSIDELTLAMKSTLSGLCKMSHDAAVREEDLEMKALNAFEAINGENDELTPSSTRIYIGRLIEWAMNDPEVVSWLSYYDDGVEANVSVMAMHRTDIDYEYECDFLPRGAQVAANIAHNAHAFKQPR